MDHTDFMKIALEQAKAALSADEFPVGCVITCDNQVIAKGSRSASFGKNTNEIDHAEINALRRLAGESKKWDTERITLYSTMEPCLMCFSAIMLCGITKVVYAYEDVMGGGTKIDLNNLAPLYSEKKITIIPDILRAESLKLFKFFFENPEHLYWKDSLLARYTLSQ